ncbi:MAG TPA: tRNA glutamyl-Q(34) synthetase GluQRS [Rhizomicrobium sp.]|jgi:glutamyl-Q tRNA(Asp) synthetase|nr:tRNA glutamyl-Q(34) synthetase GluQRS [Rhizomicrobium sp.]
MIVTRFAPSPTGYLHLGHAYAALVARDAAKLQSDGCFLLRIEDIDAARCKPEFEQAIYEDLAWLGLDWEKPVLRQSERFDAYRTALGNLEAQGLLYPCFCTRKEIAEEVARAAEAPHSINLGPEGALYPGTCRKLSAAERKAKMAQGALYALRLDVEMAASMAGAITFQELGRGPNGETGTITVNPCLFGDIVLARKETPAAYHLAVVVDDAFQNVTLVTRGHDLFAATHVQRLLQTLLDLPAPSYGHHDLVLDEQGRKFSKRDNAVTLRALRERGVTPDEIRARLF